ncbi:AraC family transcriptional regulator [Paucibacter soli]|uniref:AraC family transcriptional regulator n=1 Tax=Paucibacter soli TaxID=3133433 RepID=UPI0030982670
MASSSELSALPACTNPTGLPGCEIDARALLDRQPQQGFQLQRLPVCAALAPWLDYHWLIEWDLPPGRVHRQRVLPYPNTHLVFEAGATALHGVARGVYVRELSGRGRVHGLRFKCGGLRPWLAGPVQALHGRSVPATPCVGADVPAAEQAVLGEREPQRACAAAEALLLARRPAVPALAGLDEAVQHVLADVSITRAVQLQALLGLGERALQRCFAEHVGVAPKWVIQRARLQDALLALGQPDAPPLAELALRLGFCDQAHFSRSLRQTLGQSPQQLRAMLLVTTSSRPC